MPPRSTPLQVILRPRVRNLTCRIRIAQELRVAWMQAKKIIERTRPYTIMTSTWNSLVAESEQNESTRAFNVGIFIPVSAFQMEHLVEICCEDLDLVSDVLDTFCVQGRQRLEAMERVMEHDDLGDIVFEAVR